MPIKKAVSGCSVIITLVGVVTGIILLVLYNGGSKVCDQVPWLEISPKRPIRVRVSLGPNSDFGSGVGGFLKICSEGTHCCSTDRFNFSAPTVLHLSEDANCREFALEKKKNLTFQMRNEDPDKVQVFRVKLTLEDGSSYQNYLGPPAEKNQWSNMIHLKENDPQNQDLITVMKVQMRNVKDNPNTCLYVNGSKVELRRLDSGLSCSTNPLPWPIKDSTTKLNSVETLGSCFTFEIGDAGDNLEVKYHTPSNADMPYDVTWIKMSSLAKPNFGWKASIPRQAKGSTNWLTADFDDDA